LEKKEESCHELEVEVVNLRKKVEKSDTQIKFLNKSMTLDEILDSQRSPNDKSGLGYNKEEISTPKKSDASPSFIKYENSSKMTPSFVKSESRYDLGSSCSKNKSNATKFRRSASRKTSRSYSYTSKKVHKRDTFMDESKKV
jgi:hypothetical protein